MNSKYIGLAIVLAMIVIVLPSLVYAVDCDSCAACSLALDNSTNTIVTLNQSITANESSCISLNGFSGANVSNLILDCQGYDVIGWNNNSALNGIFFAGGTNLTIQNCNVSGFVIGLSVGYFNDTMIINNTVTGRTDVACGSQSGTALSVYQGVYNQTIFNNTINISNSPISFTGHGSDTRLSVNASHNTVTNFHNQGLLATGNNTWIEYNDISLPCGSYSNSRGIESTGNIRNSTITNNYIHDMNYCAAGIATEHNANYINITNNNLTNLYNCPQIFAGGNTSTNIIIDNNTIYNNTNGGYAIQFNGYTNVTDFNITNNVIYNNTGGILVQNLKRNFIIENNTITNVSLSPYAYSSIQVTTDVKNGIIKGNNITNSYWGIELYTNTSNVTVEENNIYNVSAFGILTDNNQPDTVTNITIMNNIINKTANVGICNNRGSYNNTIFNNTVTDTGNQNILLNQLAHNINVSNNNLSSPHHTNSLDISSSSYDNLIFNNTIRNATYGIITQVFNNFRNIIANNTVSECGNTCIFIATDDDNTTIENNTVFNATGAGIYCNGADNCIIRFNNVSNAMWGGINLYDSDNSLIELNYVHDQTDWTMGYTVQQSNNVTIQNNTIYNGGTGFGLDCGTTNSLAQYNNATNNKQYGYQSYCGGVGENQTANNTFRHNIAFNNSLSGMQDLNSFNILYENNTVDCNKVDDVNAQRGIDSINSYNASIHNNKIYNCTWGALIEGNDHVFNGLIAENTIENMWASGIVFGSYDAFGGDCGQLKAINNTILRSRYDGIRLDGCDNLTIFNNTIIGGWPNNIYDEKGLITQMGNGYAPRNINISFNNFSDFYTQSLSYNTYGTFITNSINITIHDNTFDNITSAGQPLFQAWGFATQLTNTNNSKIYNNIYGYNNNVDIGISSLDSYTNNQEVYNNKVNASVIGIQKIGNGTNYSWHNNNITGAIDMIIGTGIGFFSSYNAVNLYDNDVWGNNYGLRIGYVGFGYPSANITAHDNILRNNEYNLFINSQSFGNDIYNNSIYNGLTYDIYLVNTTSNQINYTTLGDSGSEIVLDLDSSHYMTINEVPVGSRHADPLYFTNISKYFEAANLSSSGYLNVTIYYNQSDIGNLTEGSLQLREYKGGSWQVVQNQTLDIVENKINANVTIFSQFGVFGGQDNDLDGYAAAIDCNDNNATIIPLINDTITYLITSKVLCTDYYNNASINIQSDNVIFDCNGSTLANMIYGWSTIAVDGYDNITTKNCNFDNDDSGIYYRYSDNGNIYNHTFTNSIPNGIILAFSSNNTISNLICSEYGDYCFFSSDNGVNYIGNNVYVNSTATGNLTKISGSFNNVGISRWDSPSSTPIGRFDLGRYVNISSTYANSWANISIYYQETDYPNYINESSIKIYEDDGFMWNELTSEINTINNFVYSNLTSFSGFGLFGQNMTAPTGNITFPTPNHILTYTTNIPINYSIDGGTSCRIIAQTENFTQINESIPCNSTKYKFDAIGSKEYNVSLITSNPINDSISSVQFKIERDTVAGTTTMGLLFILLLGLCFFFVYVSGQFSNMEHPILKTMFIFVAIFLGFVDINLGLLGLREYAKIPSLDSISNAYQYVYIILIVIILAYFMIYLTSKLIHAIGDTSKEARRKMDR